jgi:hypothetical protein
VKEARTVRRVPDALGTWLVNDAVYNRHIVRRDAIAQREGDSLGTFITFVQPWVEENVAQVPVARWMHDTLLSKLHAQWR